MEIKSDQFQTIDSSLDILNHLDIECAEERNRIYWIKKELSILRNLDLQAFDDEERKKAIQRIETMLGEVVDHLESGGYHFRALALSRVIDEIVKGEK